MIKLGLQYRATENIAGEEIATATKGLLLVAVIRANNLSSHDNLVTSYVSVKVAATSSLATHTTFINKSLNGVQSMLQVLN